MTTNKTKILTQAQQNIVDKLKDGYIVVESYYDGKLHYEIARVTAQVCAYGMPRSVRKESVWILMSFGLIEEVKLWGENCIPKFYRLIEAFE